AAVARREVPAPLGLEDRICAAGQPEVARRTRAPRVSPLRRWLPIELTVAAALVVAGIIWTRLPDAADTTGPSAAAPTTNLAASDFEQQDLQALANSVRDLSQRFLQPATPPAETATAAPG